MSPLMIFLDSGLSNSDPDFDIYSFMKATSSRLWCGHYVTQADEGVSGDFFIGDRVYDKQGLVSLWGMVETPRL